MSLLRRVSATNSTSGTQDACSKCRDTVLACVSAARTSSGRSPNLKIVWSCAGGAEPWGGLTCDRLVEMASEVKIAMQEGRAGDRMGLAYEKLTHAYWRNHIRKTVLAAGGETRGCSGCVIRSLTAMSSFRVRYQCFHTVLRWSWVDSNAKHQIPYHTMMSTSLNIAVLPPSVSGSSTDTPYVERRSTPLSSPRWDTHRRVGCYDRTMGEGNVAYLEEGDVSPSSCAAFCSNSEESRPGTGFFGITTDRK